MKTINIKLFGLVVLAVFSFSCIKQMDEAGDAKKVEPVTAFIKINATVGFVPKKGEIPIDPNFPVKGLKAIFTNWAEGITIETIVDEHGLASVEGLIPGVYAVDISGTVNFGGRTYYLNGSAPKVSLVKSISRSEAVAKPGDLPYINIRPATVGPLCIKEIYYCGAPGWNFRNQSYEIYNNGSETFYLDSLCFAQLCPSTATATLPVWPDEDGDGNFVYGEVVWQIPGTGKDYPLAPGESIIFAQEAKLHTHEDPAHTFDNSMAEWECWSGNAARNNPDVPDLPFVFWERVNSMQWLTSVGGSAFCIYKMSTPFDPNNWQTQINKSTRYAKIAAGDVIDGVELLPSMLSLHMKRIPGFVDAGGTSVEETYCGKTVSRKKIGTRADGTPIVMDSNNSTNDFEVMEHPMIRRHGVKMPSWSPSLKD